MSFSVAGSITITLPCWALFAEKFD